MNIFDLIRQSCQQAASEARHVKIHSNKIFKYVESLPLDSLKNLVMDEQNHFCGDDEATTNYFVVLDCINFGSGYFPHLEKLPGKTGYFTVASCLKKEFIERGEFNCDFLKGITAQDCCRIFLQRSPNQLTLELMGLFADALNELGNFVANSFSGSFVGLVESADHLAANLVNQLRQMKFYQDQTRYRNQEIYFLKRAQITVSDLNIALNNSGLGYFKDLDQLTIFADNLVPHVLWRDGIFEYSRELEELINAGSLIESGSPMEIELRAAAIHAVEMMKDEAGKLGHQVTAQQLDYLLWNRGQAEIYRKPHLTLSCFY